MKIYVDYKETVEDQQFDQGDGGRWDYSWSKTMSFETLGVSLTKPEGYDYETFEVDFEVEAGEEIYTLTVIYSDGDTFGHSCGNGEVVWVFKSEEKAKEAEQLFWDNRKSYSIKFESERGETISLSNPGSGYFETLDEVRIESFVVRK